MKVLLINHSCGTGSTGRICVGIAEEYVSNGYECVIAYGRDAVALKDKRIQVKRIGTMPDVLFHVVATRLWDKHGLYSNKATTQFLQWADEYDPDVLWLHNIHGYYLNYEMLFVWIKSRPQMQVKWTLHDCWAFTGHCSYFSMAQCNQWKTHCSKCCQKSEYPASLFLDNCNSNYDRKKMAFTGVKNMTLITPSQWLADLVGQSFLGDYPVEVQYNTIDTTVFKPTYSDFRERYGLRDKKIVLGVANVWHERKGLNDFLQLAKMLNEDYVIALVGLTEKQIKKVQRHIMGLKRINSVRELVALYTMADVYVNPSKDETVGITTIEARTCGTDAIVYQNTVPEEVVTHGGIAIKPDVMELYKAITGNEYKYNGEGKASILFLPRTSSAAELAGIYTASDVFVNPTHEDNYPTTNLEAQACGTWVITYDVGGSKETLR